MRKRVVVIDNYDSFTYNLVQYLDGLGATCSVHLNDGTTPSDVLGSMPHGVVLSPGAGTPEESGVTLAVIDAIAATVPLLGVCLGHQAIGQHFGAEVRLAARPVHGRAWPIEHSCAGIFRSLPSPFMGARYHSLVVDEASLPACLEVTARTLEGEIMAMQHRSLPVQGVQFHPESILSEHGRELLQNWLDTL